MDYNLIELTPDAIRIAADAVASWPARREASLDRHLGDLGGNELECRDTWILPGQGG